MDDLRLLMGFKVATVVADPKQVDEYIAKHYVGDADSVKGLIAELAEDDKFKDLMEKALRYRQCGTQEVWILSPDTRQAFVQSEDRKTILSDDQRFESKRIPGFGILLSELFDQA